MGQKESTYNSIAFLQFDPTATLDSRPCTSRSSSTWRVTSPGGQSTKGSSGKQNVLQVLNQEQTVRRS